VAEDVGKWKPNAKLLRFSHSSFVLAHAAEESPAGGKFECSQALVSVLQRPFPLFLYHLSRNASPPLTKSKSTVSANGFPRKTMLIGLKVETLEGERFVKKLGYFIIKCPNN
jgi:hypothetical protein